MILTVTAKPESSDGVIDYIELLVFLDDTREILWNPDWHESFKKESAKIENAFEFFYEIEAKGSPSHESLQAFFSEAATIISLGAYSEEYQEDEIIFLYEILLESDNSIVYKMPATVLENYNSQIAFIA